MKNNRFTFRVWTGSEMINLKLGDNLPPNWSYWDTCMQNTGLKDRNGKEIYEGDVFPCVYAFDGCTDHVMFVEYNEPRAGFFPRWDYAKCHQKGVEKTMHDLKRLEVIGNIYENPELLK